MPESINPNTDSYSEMWLCLIWNFFICNCSYWEAACMYRPVRLWCCKNKKKKKWSNNRQVMEKPVPAPAHPSVSGPGFINELFIHHHVGVQLVTEPQQDSNHPHMMWEWMNRCVSRIQANKTPLPPFWDELKGALQKRAHREASSVLSTPLYPPDSAGVLSSW